MHPSVYPLSAASPRLSKNPFSVFPRSPPPPTVGWVYTFPRSLYFPRRRTRDSFFVDHLDSSWRLRVGEHEDRFSPFSKLAIVLTLDFNPGGICFKVGLGLFP